MINECVNTYSRNSYLSILTSSQLSMRLSPELALLIDAGKLRNHNYLVTIISNALLNVQTLLYKAYLNFDGTSKNYCEKFFQ